MDLISPVPPDPPDPGPSLMEVSDDPIVPVATKRRLEEVDSTPSKKTITNLEAASASIQTVFTDPSLTVLGIKNYIESDSGPFLVHVTRIEPDPSAGTTIRPIKFGQFLHQNKFENICQDGVKKVGRNKIAIEFKSAAGANSFLESPILKAAGYDAFIPTFNVTRMGLVRGVPVELSMEEFVGSVQIQGIQTKILKARRLNRKTKKGEEVVWEPTQTVVITFRGQQLPQRIFLFYSSLPVESYIFPTIQCMNCLRFGHIKTQCRSSARCYRCAQPHFGDDCRIIESEATCLFCSGRHFSINKCCPEQDRQKYIKLIMARDGISYADAMSQLPKTNRSYNEAAKSTNTSSSSFTDYIASQSSSQPTVPQQSQSYKKTFFSAPRPRVPLGSTYDKVAHQAIVAPVSSSLPNGHALQNSQPSHEDSQPQNQLLMQLLSIIIGIISQNSILPSNVAHMISQLTALIHHNGSSPPNAMELQEHQTQET